MFLLEYSFLNDFFTCHKIFYRQSFIVNIRQSYFFPRLHSNIYQQSVYKTCHNQPDSKGTCQIKKVTSYGNFREGGGVQPPVP